MRPVGSIAANEGALGWFFPVSKAFALLVLPSHLLLWLVAATAVALLCGRISAARGLAVAALVVFVLIGVAPTGLVVAKPLEDMYPRRPLPAKITGILTPRTPA